MRGPPFVSDLSDSRPTSRKRTDGLRKRASCASSAAVVLNAPEALVLGVLTRLRPDNNELVGRAEGVAVWRNVPGAGAGRGPRPANTLERDRITATYVMAQHEVRSTRNGGALKGRNATNRAVPDCGSRIHTSLLPGSNLRLVKLRLLIESGDAHIRKFMRVSVAAAPSSTNDRCGRPARYRM